ncbi:MAG: hypothetical protein ACO3A4_15035 [Silvanigrellaceae bacterium]
MLKTPLLAGIILFATLSPAALAIQSGAGGGVVTVGDDRLMPAVNVWLRSSSVVLESSFVGEKNSAYTQQIAFPQLSYSTSLGKSKTLEGSLGLGGLISQTKINAYDDSGESNQKLATSAGLALGLHWTPAFGKDLRMRMSWNSLFIPPGTSVLYLALGHMQSVTLGLGWEF